MKLDMRDKFVLMLARDYSNELMVNEIGPGSGKIGVALSDEGHVISFFDKDQRVLDNLLDIFVWEKIVCDIADKNTVLPKCDVAIACEVLEHTDNWRQALDNMMDCANRVIVTVPVGNSYYDPGHRHFFNLNDWRFLPELEDWDWQLWAMPTKAMDLTNGQAVWVVCLTKKEGADEY